MPLPVHAVIFDLDGTLIDTEAVYRHAFFAAMADLGLAFEPARYAALVGLSTPDRLALLGPGFPAEAFRARYYARRGEMLDGRMVMRPGARALLAALARAGVPTAIATSASRATAGRHLAMVPHLFDAVVTRDDVARHKPHPEPFLAAAAALGMPAAACLAVEDSAPGLAAARAAGMVVALAGDLRALRRALGRATTVAAVRSSGRPPDAGDGKERRMLAG